MVTQLETFSWIKSHHTQWMTKFGLQVYQTGTLVIALAQCVWETQIWKFQKRLRVSWALPLPLSPPWPRKEEDIAKQLLSSSSLLSSSPWSSLSSSPLASSHVAPPDPERTRTMSDNYVTCPLQSLSKKHGMQFEHIWFANLTNTNRATNKSKTDQRHWVL